jgi:radical SAM protein (TIGR01212 family)
MLTRRYLDLNTVLRERFGFRVQKISLDAGLTCPNRDGTLGTGGCIYCNALGSGTGLSCRHSLTEQLERAKEHLRRRYGARKFIAYFQSFSNTYAPLETLRSLYREALVAEDVVGLAIGTRPDCVPDEVLDLLEEVDRKTYLWVEYGLQSIHERTLEAINRGHGVSAFLDAVRRTRARGLGICVHVILGLPGEGSREMLETARALGALDIQAVKLHLLYVVRGTALASLYSSGRYRCLSREEYVDLVCEFLTLLPPTVVIHRLTGDPHPHELVAPGWAREKRKNLQAIREALERRDLWQGKYWEAPSASDLLADC